MRHDPEWRFLLKRSTEGPRPPLKSKKGEYKPVNADVTRHPFVEDDLIPVPIYRRKGTFRPGLHKVIDSGILGRIEKQNDMDEYDPGSMDGYEDEDEEWGGEDGLNDKRTVSNEDLPVPRFKEESLRAYIERAVGREVETEIVFSLGHHEDERDARKIFKHLNDADIIFIELSDYDQHSDGLLRHALRDGHMSDLAVSLLVGKHPFYPAVLKYLREQNPDVRVVCADAQATTRSGPEEVHDEYDALRKFFWKMRLEKLSFEKASDEARSILRKTFERHAKRESDAMNDIYTKLLSMQKTIPTKRRSKV
jgi:hypothetical protein